MFKKVLLLTVFTALFFGLCPLIYAEENPSPTPTPVLKPTPKLKTIDQTCMQNAIDKRDGAIIAAVDVFATFMKTALTTRKDTQKTAWGINDRTQRKVSLKDAWTKFKGSWLTALKNLRKARNAAWKQFYIDRKVCGSTSLMDDKITEGTDAF